MLITEATLSEDMKRLLADREIKDLEALRAKLRVTSLKATEELMEQATLALETAFQVLQDTYLRYDEDEDVDFETALDRAHKVESIERNFDLVGKMWGAQRKRVAWENNAASV